jgi:hypothetical protein
MAQEPGLPGQPEAGPASDGNHGAPNHLPAPQDEPTSSWPPSISVLLWGVEITRPNQVWTADITHIPMA